MILDAAISLVGLIVPPAFDFVKKKFLSKKEDDAMSTISSLATTKPEIMPSYVDAMSKLIDSQVRHFNRDVSGDISSWVSDLRASIRPIFVILSILVRSLGWALNWQIDESFISTMDLCISSWFGSRLF